MNPLLAQFLAEANDLLASVDDGLLQLERNPGDPELTGMFEGIRRFNDPSTNRESLDPGSWAAYDRINGLDVPLRVLAPEQPPRLPAALDAARQRLADALVELRATADAASGEWWPRSLPQEQVMRTEEDGHRTLAATVRRLGLHAPEANTGSITEDAQP